MKKLFPILTFSLALFFNQSASALVTCRDIYAEGKWMASNDIKYIPAYATVGTGTFIVGIATSSLVTGIAGFALIPAGMGVAYLHDLKRSHMIQLIDDAETYSQLGGYPGKYLSRFHAQLPEGSLTIEETAAQIREGNQNLSLCQAHLFSRKELLKAMSGNEAL